MYKGSSYLDLGKYYLCIYFNNNIRLYEYFMMVTIISTTKKSLVIIKKD